MKRKEQKNRRTIDNNRVGCQLIKTDFGNTKSTMHIPTPQPLPQAVTLLRLKLRSNNPNIL